VSPALRVVTEDDVRARYDPAEGRASFEDACRVVDL